MLRSTLEECGLGLMLSAMRTLFWVSSHISSQYESTFFCFGGIMGLLACSGTENTVNLFIPTHIFILLPEY